MEGLIGCDPGQLDEAEWDSQVDGYSGLWRDDLRSPADMTHEEERHAA